MRTPRTALRLTQQIFENHRRSRPGLVGRITHTKATYSPPGPLLESALPSNSGPGRTRLMGRAAEAPAE